MIQESNVHVRKQNSDLSASNSSWPTGKKVYSKDVIIAPRSISYAVKVGEIELQCLVQNGRVTVDSNRHNGTFMFKNSDPDLMEVVALALLECAKLGKKKTR